MENSKYEKLANKITEKIMTSNGTITLTTEEALEVLNCVLGMSRVMKIAESDHGGAEYVL